ncbi:hypothetical protein D3C75_1223170 [compost metagenome]
MIGLHPLKDMVSPAAQPNYNTRMLNGMILIKKQSANGTYILTLSLFHQSL